MRAIQLLYAAVLLLLGLLSGDAVSLRQSVPKQVKAGGAFDVEVTVSKGNLESFARYTVQLPYGLKVLAGEGANADFQFEYQQARFIWFRLPNQDEFKLRYRVEVDERLKGTFELGGEFDYVRANARATVALAKQTITIEPSAAIPPDKRLDIEEFQRAIPAQRPIDLRRLKVRCFRERPVRLASGEDLEVNLLVNKGEADNYAKIEEQLPPGYTAEPIETRDAIFSFENGLVRLIWKNQPATPTYTAAYRLVPMRPGLPPPEIYGTFSFIRDGATQVIAVEQRDMELSQLTPAQVESLVRSSRAHAPVGRDVSSAATEGALTGSDASGSTRASDTRGSRRPSRRPSRSQTGARQRTMDEYLLAPEEGVYYRVQVAAGHRPVDIARYFRRLDLHADVRTERHDGWYKYSVGSFKEYKEARDYRVQVWTTTPINDAFVAAYNNGKRITVQEALMITSQRWYR